MGRESIQSSATISNEPSEIGKNKALPQVFFNKDQKHYIYVGKDGASAFSIKTLSFCSIFPFCLFLTMKQPYILYFVINVMLRYFKYGLPSTNLIDTVVEFFLLIMCVLLEMIAKYRTYLQYTTRFDEETQKTYKIWNIQKQRWDEIYENELKVGQIVMIQKYFEGNNKLNPANLLPIAISSQKKYIQIKTTKIDKKQQYTKVKLLKPLRRLVKKTQNNLFQFKEKLFSLEIHYRFMSQLGSTFQAVLFLKDHPQKQFLISQQNVIPFGVPISTEQYVIGIVLQPSENDLQKKIKSELSQSNKINLILNRYLWLVTFMNLAILILITIINFVITISTTRNMKYSDYSQYFKVLILSLSSILINTIYISMYVLIAIDRIINNWKMKSKHKIVLKNWIKSFDQISQTNTLIMDDYFFLQKIFNIQDFQFIVNQQSPLTDQLHLFIKIIEESPLLKQYMSGHTIPIAKYFRWRIIKKELQKKGKIKILKQTLIDNDCIEIKIKIISRFSQQYYLIRFNDKPVESTIRKIQNSSLKSKLEELIVKYRVNNHLLLFIEMMKTQIDTMNGSNKSFQFFGAISFIEEINANSLSLIKEPKIMKKYNIVILTNKTWKYINYYMQKSSMRQNVDNIIVLQEKQEKQMYNIMKNHLKTIKDEKSSNIQKKKKTLLFLDSNMITYLSRRNIRKSLFKLASDCKYVVFYNCSEYQKQICAVNLFKIFPDHIYLSNFISDEKIFKYSNVSASQRGSSSQNLTTLMVNRFKNLQTVLLQESTKSIQIVYCIINSHVFKNQLLVICIIMTFLLVFRGNSVDMGISFVNEINFFYNFVFTIMPISFLILKRPQMYVDDMVKHYITAKDIISINIKAIIFGCSITFLTYGFISEQYVQNIQTSVLINITFSSNLFVLFLDNSVKKKNIIIVMIFQLLFSLSLIILIQLFNWQQYFLFVKIGTNFDPKNIWFFITTFAIMPILCFLILFSFSASRQVMAVQPSQSENEAQFSKSSNVQSNASIIDNQLNNTQIVLKISKSKGKQIYFQEFQ